MSAALREAALRREVAVVSRIPYVAHVAPHLVRTELGDYVQAFRLGGASFECADDETLNSWHERLNVLWRNVASPQVSVWTHVIRRREVMAQSPRTPDFAGVLEHRYRARLSQQTLMVNELYLSLVYRPTAGVATGLASRILKRTRPASSAWELTDAIESCEKLRDTVQASLDRYEPESLTIYSRAGRSYSGLLNLMFTLINGELREVPLPRAPINEVLGSARLSFGTEVLEYRQPTATRVGAILGIKEYPTPTQVGMFDGLLSAPFPFVLTQSFTFLS
jgi:type IV secretion system protein VirB4